MNIGECGIGQLEIKIECNDFSEAIQLEAVKNEQIENYVFTKCMNNSSSSTETDFADHKHAADSYHEHEQNEGKLFGKNRKPNDSGHSKFFDNPSSTCDSLRIKNDDDIDILYEDIKRETGQEKSSDGFCGVCGQSFGQETDFFNSTSCRSECSCQRPNASLLYDIEGQDMKPDVNPLSLDSILDSRLQILGVQDETITGSEAAKEEDSCIMPQRILLPPVSSSRENTLKIHEIVDTGKKTFHCKCCSKSFSSMGNLRIHVRIHTGEKPFNCKFCSKSFSRNDSLRSHERSHTGEKPFQCKICSKSFIRNNILRLHERGHTGKKPFHCTFCSKSFSSMGNLIIHVKVHTGEKPFNCEYCSKSFSRNDTLRIHERSHTGEKPFQCKICSKSFIRNNTLRIHERVHTGVKPFQCKICSKSFSIKGSLIIHVRSHTGEKPFSCEFCSKSFSRNSNLRIHKRVHTGEKPFHCQICSKSFSQNGSLIHHVRSHTGEKPFN